MRALGVGALLLATLQVGRAEVLGGGLARSDCRMVFGGVTATNGRSGVVCTDGDPACDDDGVADGTCRFAVNVCTGRPTPACDTASFSAISVAGLRLEPPRVPAPDGTCGRKLGVEVPSGTAAGATALALDGTALRDVDYLDLCCVAGVPTPLDAARCAVETALRVSGCPASKIARGARLAFTRAHELVTEFGRNPVRPQVLARALRKLVVVRRAAQRLAKHNDCGDALGLVVSYAQDVVGAARAAATR
jgi:hypothetical protein